MICHKCNRWIGDEGYRLDDFNNVYHNYDCSIKPTCPPWPTLEGRQNQSIATELEALQQLEQCVPLSEYGKERLRKLLNEQ